MEEAQREIRRVIGAAEEFAEPVESPLPPGRALAHRLPQFERLDPGLDPHRHDFGKRHANNGARAIVHQLGDRAGADRTDIAGLVAHRVEHRFVPAELLLVAADPDRHLAARGAPRPAADRRIQHIEVLLGEGGVDLAHDRDRIGRHVEERGIGLHPLDQAVGPQRHRLDIGRNGEGGENHLGCFGDLARRIGPDGALGEERLGRGAIEVVDGELVAGVLQFGRHALAHHAEPDETYAHLDPPPLATDTQGSAVWPGRSVERKPRRRAAVFYSTSWLLVVPIDAVPTPVQLLLKFEPPLKLALNATSRVHADPVVPPPRPGDMECVFVFGGGVLPQPRRRGDHRADCGTSPPDRFLAGAAMQAIYAPRPASPTGRRLDWQGDR